MIETRKQGNYAMKTESVRNRTVCNDLNNNHTSVLTPDFGMVKNVIKKVSNGKMIKVRKFHIVKRRNFDIWAIAIRSHL